MFSRTEAASLWIRIMSLPRGGGSPQGSLLGIGGSLLIYLLTRGCSWIELSLDINPLGSEILNVIRGNIGMGLFKAGNLM